MVRVDRKVLPCLLILLAGCTEEVGVFEPGLATPVVYCLLNPDAEDQYVRLGRTFNLDPADTAISIVADSTVWNQPVDVYIEEWDNDQKIKTYEFESWPATAKDSGLFPRNNLCLYRAEFQPERLTTYRLYVHFPDDNRLVFATTIIPDKPAIHDPLPIPGRKINLQSEVNYTVRWTPADFVGLYQCFFHLTYSEEIHQELTFHQVLFGNKPAIETTVGSVISWVLSGNRFFQEMSRQISVNPEVNRKVVNIQFRFYTGGEELAFQASPDIIAGSMNPLNPYSNIYNGIGIFSSIQVLTIDNLELSNTTLKELAEGNLTRNLGFIFKTDDFIN